MKRKCSKEHARKVWKKTKSISKVARRIGYTITGARRLLRRYKIVK